MTEKISPLAGKLLEPAMLVDVPRLVTAYFTGRPDPAVPAQRVSFGTSGHRGSSFADTFNESHILAITQALCDHRRVAGITGPVFVGIDTHALSRPALATAIEVFAANAVDVFIDQHDGFTPTPVISQAILTYNRGRTTGLADGVVVTPSHNPPTDGGFKYNAPNGGPADAGITDGIGRGANAMLAGSLAGVRRIPFARAIRSEYVHRRDFIGPYVEDLSAVVDIEAIRASGVRIGIDPLGGASVAFWPAIIERYGLAATVVSDTVDPTFRLVGMRDKFDVAFANDTDADRHGIVAGPDGLMNPNHFLAVAIAYLFGNRPGWGGGCAVGKTVVSSGMIDRVAAWLGRPLFETPVGFKWFVDGLFAGTLGFAGEESAGASFLRRDGSVWTTDKDGLILGLLAAEITARTGKSPAVAYETLTQTQGTPHYERIDAPATPTQKALLKALSPGQFPLAELAGEPVLATLDAAPGNGAPIGGLKVQAKSGWFAARPSGTEDTYKIYAESFRSEAHLRQIERQAQDAIARVLELRD
jgi:phosphoglucomutase